MNHLIFLLAALLLAPLAALPVTAQPRSGGSAPVAQGVKAHRDLAYVVNGHERQKLDLFVPEKADGPLPLIIWIHGGGWQNGSKEGCPPLRNGYTERGYAVASINYRLSGHAVFPAQIEDCKAAIRWLRAHAEEYRLDPKRFGVWGSSAGGHLVALAGTSGDVKAFDVGAHLEQSSRVQAVCDYFGPTDFTVFVTTPGYESHATANSPEAKLIGGAVMENKDRAARANPITYVSKDDPAFLIVHGDKDPLVPINQSQLLYDALKQAGVNVHFHTIKGAGHGQGFGGPEIEPMVADFFDRVLKTKPLPPNLGPAKTSDSNDAPAPAAGKGKAGTPKGGGKMSWERVRGIEGVEDDGRVARNQFKGPAAMFDRLDRNRDGFVSKEDFNDVAATNTATAAKNPATGSGEFQINGERWTYRDGDFVMDGILLKPEGKGPFPAVLISHGLGGSAESFGLTKAREMVKWGFVCIAPSYTHSAGAQGDRPGAPKAGPPPKGADSGQHLADYGASAQNLRRARTCLDLVSRMPEVNTKRLFGYGHSMGGFVTIGLAAIAPDSLQAAAITGSGIAPEEGFPAPSAAKAEQVRTPFLILHGSADAVVRPQQSADFKAILDKNRVVNERTVYDGEGHPIDQTQRERVFTAVRAWFEKHGAKQP
ncbi:MAG: prolyl oligopeptidase family serine peptidase [Verrucomicrobiales bacterium]